MMITCSYVFRMQFLLIFLLADHPPLTYGDYVYPAWSNVLSAMISLSIFICIPVYAVYGFCTQPGDALQVDRILHLWDAPIIFIY